MCTVSFIPLENNDFIFTSSRDEVIGRTTLVPDFYTHKNIDIWMPKDEKSGGTWIGATNKKRVVCLLNGAFEKHVKKNNYRHSRGVVVNNFLMMENYFQELENYNLNNIEPFTLIIIDWNIQLQLTEIIWDGMQKYISKLPIEAKIWCSSTLYTTDMKHIRKHWFENYLSENEKSQASLLNFHQNYGVGDKNIDLQIDRGLLKTVSITAIAKKGNVLRMEYVDLLQDKKYKSTFQNIKTILNHV